MFSPSLRARGSKTRETPSQQPLHAIPTGSPLLRYGGFAAKKGADARLLAGCPTSACTTSLQKLALCGEAVDTRLLAGMSVRPWPAFPVETESFRGRAQGVWK